MTKKLNYLFVVMFMSLFGSVGAQNLGDYSYSTGVDATKWIHVSDTTNLLAGVTGIGDGFASSIQDIGFIFRFASDAYSSFSVNTDGNLRLGDVATGTGSYTNPFSSSNSNTNNPKINAFGCDGAFANAGNYVRSQLVGTAPNRVRVVEYCGSTYNNNSRSSLIRWQVQLFENGDVQMVFDSVAPTIAPAVNRQCGMCSSSSNGVVITLDENGAYVANAFTNGSTDMLNLNTWFDSCRYFLFQYPSSLSCMAPAMLAVDAITDNSAQLSWFEMSSATSWVVEWGVSGFTPGSGNVVNASSSNITLTGLTPNSYYDVYVKSSCADSLSDAAMVSFHTLCTYVSTDSLPYLYGFEDATGSGSSHDFSPCWSCHAQGTTTRYPYPSNANTHDGDYSLLLYGNSSVSSWATLPLFESNINELQLAFYAFKNSATYGRFMVGVMTNPDDFSTFDTIAELYVSETGEWTYFEVPLSLYTGQGLHLAISSPSGSTNNVYIDDISVDLMPDCPRVMDLEVSNITTTEANVAWNESGSATSWIVEYGPYGFVRGEGIAMDVNSTQVHLTNLATGTDYDVYVSSLCSSGDTSMAVKSTFSTVCGMLTLPYEFGFETSSNGSASSVSVINCWSKINDATSTSYQGYPYVASVTGHAYQGSKYLYFQLAQQSATTGYAHNSYAIFPPVDIESTPMNTVELLFHAKSSSATVETPLYIGVMTHPDSAETFQVIDTVILENEYNRFVVDFSDYTDTGRYVAIKAKRVNTTVYAYVDEVTMRQSSPCPEVSGIEILSVTADSATISWNYDENISYVDIYLAPAGFNSNDISSVNTSDTVYYFSELIADTEYEFYIVTYCNDGSVSYATPRYSFRTSCLPVLIDSMPYVENFDSYLSGSNNSISSCWTKGTNYASTAYPYPYATYSYSPSNSLYFYSSSTIYSYAAMPMFEAGVRSLHVSFQARRYSSSSYSSAIVLGVMSQPGDFSTFEPYQVCAPTCEFGQWQEFNVSMEEYQGDGRFIAFALPSGSTNYAYIDDVVVSILPDCRRPLHPQADSVTAYDATLSWVYNGNPCVFEVAYSTQPDFNHDTCMQVAVSNDTSIQLINLNPFTEYYWAVRADCGNETGEWSEKNSFITMVDCGPNSDNVIGTIGDSTNSSSTYLMYTSSTSYQSGYSWHIYDALELNELGIYTNNIINAISLHTTSTGGSVPMSVYMMETDMSTFSATSDTIPFDSMTCVYRGTIDFDERSWNVIPFDTVFPYSGTQNLVVAFRRDTVQDGNVSFAFTHMGSNNYKSVYGYLSSSGNRNAYRTLYRADLSFNFCTTIPTCERPDSVSLVGLTDTTASYQWVGDASQFEVSYGPAGFDPDTVDGQTSLVVYDDFVTLTGLTPDMNYDFYVRSICGNTTSPWSFTSSFKTPCVPISLPFYEDFDSYTGASSATNSSPVSSCEFTGTSNTMPYPHVYYTTTYASNNLRFYSTSSHYSYFALPLFTDSVHNTSVYFELYKTSANYGHLYVGLMTDPQDVSTFTKVADAKVDALNTWEQFEIVFDTFRNAGQYIAFLQPDSITSYTMLDNIVVSRLASCRRPDNVETSNITANSATISWDSPSAAPSFEIEYGYAGFAQGFGTVVTANTDSVVLTGLDNSRYYDVYVRAICSATDTSQWSLVHTFFTDCGMLSTFPYFNDFENEENGGSNINTYPQFVPCWTRINTSTSASYQGYPYVYSVASHAYSGSRSLYFYTGSSTSYPDVQMAILPQVDTTVVDMNDLQLTFYAKRNSNYTTKLYIGILTDTTDYTTFTTVDSVDMVADYDYYEVLFDQYTGYGSFVAFRIDKVSTSSYAYVDDVSLELIPTCRRPDGLVATNVTSSSVQLGWTDDNSATQWEIEYGPQGFVPTSGTAVVVNTNPAVVTGLTPGTIYDAYVRAICAPGDTSRYSRVPVLFSTSQVPATIPYSYNFDDAAEWNNWQTSSNQDINWFRDTADANSGTYSMYISADSGATRSTRLNQVVNAVAYRDIDFGTTANSFELTFNALVGGSTDGNYDGVSVVLADPATVVESSSTSLNTPWGHVNDVSISTARHDSVWTSHSVYFDNISGVKRVAFYWFNQNTQSSHPFEGGPAAVDDVAIDVQACARPYALTVDNILQTTVDLSWGGPANTAYEVSYREYPDGTVNQVVNASTNSITLTGLNSSTDYIFWVRKICGSDTSAYSVSAQFTTLCDFFVAVDTVYEDFHNIEGSTYNTEGILPNCWEGYSNGTDSRYIPHVVSSGTYWYTASDSSAIIMTSGSSVTYGDTKIVRLPRFREPISSITMSYWMATEGSSQGTLYVGYMTGENYETDFVPVKSIAASSETQHYNSGYQPERGLYDTVSFDSVPANAMYIAFMWYHNATFYSVCIDNVKVTAVDMCPAPVIGSVTGDYASATMTWSGSGNDYEVAFKRSDVAVWNDSVDVVGNTYTFAGLTPATSYDLRVRMDCNADSNGYSSWAHTQFTTDSLPCFAPTDVEIEATTYTSVTVDWTPATSETSWVVNIFRGDINIMDTVSTHPATIDNLYADMNYNVAVQAMCGNGVLYSDWSDTIQFTTDVCQPVSDVVVSDVTNNSAVIAWTAPEGSTSWQINYGEMDFIADQGTLVDVSENPFTLTGLERNSYYDVYVRNQCTENVYSVWSTPVVSFQTTNVGIDAVEAAQLQIYPNPATGAVTISISGQNGMVKIDIVDINGRTVVSDNLQCDTDCVKTMNVESLSQGAYFVRIVGEEVNMVKKLIVR